ncbi:MAG: CARDB domain-containing protein, partial [Phycisphaeraceae bacterium]
MALGLAFAVLAHLTAGVVAAHWLVGQPREIERAEREQEMPEQAKLADLVAEAVDVSEPRVAGQPSRVNVRIANRGEASAESFAYVLRIEDDVLIRGRAEAGLAAGATLEHEVEHTVARGGTHRLTLEADPEQAIEDGDRTNNRLSVSYFWAVPPEQREEGVDVAVAELRIGEPRIVGAPVTVSGRVVNQGRSPAGVFNLTLLIDGKPVEERTLDTLGSGESQRFVTRIYIDEPGEHEVTLAADLAGITDDLDRSNNAISQVAQWKTAEEMERPKVGQRAPSPVTINWISYEDYEDLVARRAE